MSKVLQTYGLFASILYISTKVILMSNEKTSGPRIDITSSAVEKGLEIAKSFLDKLIMPGVEEVGLMIKESVSQFRFRNQLKILNKANKYCEDYNVKTGHISMKLLCPLLDFASLEENEDLQDKWAILLGNMVDSEANIQNHVFPYILSQLSTNEFEALEKAYENEIERIKDNSLLFDTAVDELVRISENIGPKISALQKQLHQLQNQDILSSESQRLTSEIHKLKQSKDHAEDKVNKIYESMENGKKSDIEGIIKYETSNLIRLGVAKEHQDLSIPRQEINIPQQQQSKFYGTRQPTLLELHSGMKSKSVKVGLKLDITTSKSNVITELGMLFVNACKKKAK